MDAKSPMVPALHILDLSPDVLSLVLRHLNTEDILQLEMTCKYLALAVKESDAYKFGLQNFLGIDASETKAQRLSRLRMLPRIHRRKIPRYGIHTATQASALDLDDEVRPLETDPFHVTAKYLLEHEIGAANETLATNYSSFPYLHSSQFWKRLALWLTYKQRDAVSSPQIGLQLSTKNRDIPLDSFRYVEHADAYSAPSSSRPSNYQTFTITGWFYIDPQLLIQYDHESDDDATGHPLVYLVSDDTKGRLGFRDTYNCCVLYFDHLTRRIFTAHEVYGPVETFTSLQEIECGKWFHIAFSSYKVWNKDFASLYVNGQSYGVQFEHPGFSASSKTRPQVFVASYATGRRNPLIKHSQILVYNNKLSDNDIALLASIAPPVQTQAKSHDFGEPSLGTTEHVEHTGYGCDSCNMYPARGLIFKCMACRASYDLCGECMKTTAERSLVVPGRYATDHDDSHCFIALRFVPEYHLVANRLHARATALGISMRAYQRQGVGHMPKRSLRTGSGVDYNLNDQLNIVQLVDEDDPISRPSGSSGSGNSSGTWRW